jgi:hypothetical protein
MRIILVFFALLLSACATTSPLTKSVRPIPTSLTEFDAIMQSTDVLILSDHTKPQHLNLSSGGAQGRERDFIDPAAVVFANQLSAQGLSSYILNVEDVLFSGSEINTKAQFDTAYGHYDDVIRKAVANKVTIVSLHFDADIILAEEYKDGNLYVGGVHFISDKANLSAETFKLTYFLLHDYKVLESLNQAGFRTRPGYQNEVRYQDNLTLKISGGSQGGGFLLELAPQEQAIRLYDTPDATAQALAPSLALLAKGISDFRKQLAL